MPENYVLIERTELNTTAASVTFANIPQTGYTDLKIVFSTRDNNGQAQNGIFVSINGSTANFTNRYLLGSGSAASSGSIARFLGYSSGAGATANTFSNGELYFPNYTSSNNKSFSSDNVQETNATAAYSVMAAHLWSQTAAITSITLTADSASFVAGSTFSLYGIAAVGTTPAIAPKASGGNVIDYDGTYWIHTFTSSGTFTPQVGLTCDYLVIAGGGGGGYQQGGGGGGGGLRSTVTTTGGGGSLESAIAVAGNTPYAITVGAGGAGRTSIGAAAISGSDSVFSTITSAGGGGGGSNGSIGLNGGSGGGGAINATTAGTGTTNQGRSGGTGNTSTGGGGGGGGANTAGTNASGNGGNGGAGVAVSISGLSVNYAGGGGGGANSGPGWIPGAGGIGGGGSGSATTTPAGNGTVNLGGGGGASGQNAGTVYTNAGNGGAGVVIIRYLAA
jgi:hypothetical protein